MAKRLSHRQLASIAYRQVSRIAQARQANGIVSDVQGWLKAGANILSSGKEGWLGPRRGREAPEWWGLSVATLWRFARDCHLDVTREQIERQVGETKAWRAEMSKKLGRPHQHLMQMDRLGELLGVIEDERREAMAWSIGTVGGSQEARRQADNNRRRIRRAAKRREEGKPIRERVKMIDGKKPWEIEGISRTVWFGSRKKANQAIQAGLSVPTCKGYGQAGLMVPGLSVPTCKDEAGLSVPTCNINTHSAGSVSDLSACGSKIETLETAAFSGLPAKEASSSADYERSAPELLFPIVESSIVVRGKRWPVRIQEYLGGRERWLCHACAPKARAA